ncbi:MAG: hypothetical protein IPL14_05415 [Nitrospira sp.]|nr:hypothetical protein [Nitrospira sp.]
MTWSVVEDAAMTRFVPGFIVLCVILLLAGCAQSVHQAERLAQSDFLVDPGYAGTQSYSYWPGPGYGPGYGIGYGPGYWGHPLGYYGGPYGPLGFGWYGGYGGFGAARPPSGSPGPRPTPPVHAPRSSGKNCEPGCHREAAAWFLCCCFLRRQATRCGPSIIGACRSRHRGKSRPPV